jgi:hypothetical protein
LGINKEESGRPHLEFPWSDGMWTGQQNGLAVRLFPPAEPYKVTSRRPVLELNMRPTGRCKKFGKQTRMSEPNNRGRDMKILTPAEQAFLDVFLHEATTSPFTGPATRALHSIGVEYGDLPYLAWAFEQEVPRTSFAWGHSAEVAPPLPWTTRDAVLRRNQEIQHLWKQAQTKTGAAL